MTAVTVNDVPDMPRKSQGQERSLSALRRENVHMTFRDVCYEVKLKNKETKKILNGISGSVGGGKLCAIIGPSGAGKTTMLDILAQRQKGGTVTGDILMNGQPVDQGVFRKVSAYVQQDDILHGFLTVEETVTYAAKLRLPKEIDDDEIKRRVDHVLKLLGIDHVRDRKIGNEMVRGVSGGERKRCAIAVELVTGPSLLFLDEPTTGLDTFTALHLGYILKGLTNQGTTIIMSIHQPRSSIFRLFDQVLLINGFGEESYFGDASKAVDFLTSVGVPQAYPDNPADFLLDSVSVVRAAEELNKDDFPFLPPPTQSQDIAAAFRSTKLPSIYDMIDEVEQTFANGTGLPPANKSAYHRGFFTQVFVITHRSLLNRTRDPSATIVGLITTIFFAVLIGSIYWQVGDQQPAGLQNRLGVLFFMTMNIAFSNIGSLNIFLFDRSLYIREHKNGMYRPSAYFVGKIIQDVPFGLLFNLIFSAVAYYMVGLQPSIEKFGWFYLILTLIMLNSYGLCMMISSCVETAQVASTLAPLILVLFLLPSGFLVNLNDIPVVWRWIKYISFFRYGFEGVCLNEFEGLSLACAPRDSNPYEAAAMLIEKGVRNVSHTLGLAVGYNWTLPHNNDTKAIESTCYTTDGYELIHDKLGFNRDDFHLSMIICASTFALYVIIAYIGLRFFRGNEGK